MTLRNHCILNCTDEQLQINQGILAGALTVAFDWAIWPDEPSQLESVTRKRGNLTLVNVESDRLEADDGFATLTFRDADGNEDIADLIQEDVLRAAPIACIWNLVMVAQGVGFFAVQRMSQAAARIIQAQSNGSEEMLLRDWIIIAAFGEEATGANL